MKPALFAASVLSALLAGLAVPPAAAQEAATLKKLKESGSITLGHRESSIPFSYYDDRQQVIGYSHELMLKVVDALKAELKLAKLEVRLMPVTSANRISLVQNGTVDLECGSTTNNAARQKDVAFAMTTYVEEGRILTKANSGITGIASLNGKTVSGMVHVEGGMVTLTNFSSDEGPDLHLYLANGTTEAAVTAGKEIGKVDYSKATQTFTLPGGVDASQYTNLVEHCDKAKAVFGAAGLAK